MQCASGGCVKCVLSKNPQDQLMMMMKLLRLQFTAQACTGYRCGNNLPQGTIAVTTWLAVQGTRSQCWQKMTATMKKVKALRARAQKRLSFRRCSTYVTWSVCPLILLTSGRSRCSKTAFLPFAALLTISLCLFQNLLHKCCTSMDGMNVSWKLGSTGLQDVLCELKMVLRRLTLLDIPVSKVIAWCRECFVVVSGAVQLCQDNF